MATPESKVKAKVKELLKAHGAWFFMPVSGGFGRAGVPDFIGVHRGRFLAVETKAPGGKTTRLQDINMRDIALQGGVCFVVEGVDGTGELEAWLIGGCASGSG